MMPTKSHESEYSETDSEGEGAGCNNVKAKLVKNNVDILDKELK